MSQNVAEFAVTAIGQDRPGIVAGFTQALLQLGCNLADCSMSLLRDQFAMILLVEAPVEVTSTRLSAAMQEPARELGLQVVTTPVAPGRPATDSLPFVVSVYGRDRPGFVHAFAQALGEAGVNITDLRSHLAGEDLYAMILDVAVPASVDPEELVRGLQEIADRLEVTLTVRSTVAAEL